MTTIHIHRQLTSDTLPELRPLIGQTVDILVRAAEVAAVIPGTGDWSAWPAAVADLKDYDFDAWTHQREYDLQHAQYHLPLP
jgi:hypothetical protein